jgi:SAM-dependent methyltransferase
MDRAGQDYWDRHWGSIPQSEFRPDGGRLRDSGDATLAALVRRAFDLLPRGSDIVEVGAADSTILPWAVRCLGLRGTGLDYSVAGCERFRQRLEAWNVPADVVCCDVFAPGTEMLGRFDGAMSFGLVEHFTDTKGIVGALAAFVRPGGRLLTVIPNMCGAVGALQRAVAPSVYRVHVPLSDADLAVGHEAVGVRVLECGYLLPMGFSVVNFNEPESTRAGYWIRRLAVAGLTRVSWASWWLDKQVRLPRSRLFSPWAYCVAERSDAAGRTPR